MEFGYEAMKAHVRQQEIDQVEKAVGAIPDLSGVKFIHFGYPLGRLVPAVQAESIDDNLYAEGGAIPYSHDNRAVKEDVCVVSYLKELLGELVVLSCGKCVLCREGLRQLQLVFDSITRNTCNTQRLDYAREIAHAMAIGCDCDFGKGAGRLLENAMTDFQEEISDHIRRKRCPALICSAFYTLHILPDKCVGCGDCMDECPEDAIEGKTKFIHMIDNDICDRCGKCVAVCPEDAIVKAGPVKPRTPNRLTRVGAFRSVGSRNRDDDD